MKSFNKGEKMARKKREEASSKQKLMKLLAEHWMAF